jgi:pimeloyl-ACP methyl ester carboxylesterase
LPDIQANSITLEYETFGSADKPAVLLIMGLGTQLTGWPDHFCEGLAAEGYHVLRFDNRDIGLSTRLDAARVPNIPALAALSTLRIPSPLPLPYYLEDMAADAVGLLDALGIARAHVVGASMGGMIAQLVAAHYPQRILSLTSIMSTTGNRSLPRADRAATRALLMKPDNPADPASIVARNVRVRRAVQSRSYPKSEQELHDAAAAGVARGGYYPQGVARQLAAVIAAKDRRRLLREVAAPALVIHGDEDILVKPACGIDTAEHLPNAELMMLQGMGHDFPEQLLPQMISGIHRVAQRA